MAEFTTSSNSTFGDYINFRLPDYNRKDKIKDETQLQNYALILMISQGRAETEKNLGAGEPCVDYVQLDTDDSGGYIQPGQDRSLVRNATTTQIVAGPRYVEHSGYWTKAEVRVTNDPSNRIKNLEQRFVRRPRANHFNFIEQQLWKPPSASMEVVGGIRAPIISIPTIISEEVNGAATGATTVLGINPASKSRWRPVRMTYDAGNWTDPLTGLRASFQKMAGSLNFAPVAQGEAMNFETSETNYRFIATNLDGINMYAGMLTTLNQIMPKAQDPSYTGPSFFGHALIYIPALDSALLNSQDGTAYTSAWPTGKPRFYWVDPKYLYLKYDPQEFITQTEVMSGSAEGKPDVEIFYIRSRIAMFTHSRRMLGCICPKRSDE